MKIYCKYLLSGVLTTAILLLLISGCSVGSNGFGFGPFWYSDPGPTDGYSGPYSDIPSGNLGCEITYPPSGTKAGWEQTIWIYGVVWRQDVYADTYPWTGPLWYVDNGQIGENYYFFDRSRPEVWVRFPLDGRIIGPGQHTITLQAWDNRGGGVFPISDSIFINLE
ncbi:MAG: hypothetical protein NTY09_02805 [bacterium]|nr:hypothetical protein [bacterium]